MPPVSRAPRLRSGAIVRIEGAITEKNANEYIKHLGGGHWPDRRDFTRKLNEIVAVYARATTFPISPQHGSRRLKDAKDIRSRIRKLLSRLDAADGLLFEAACSDEEWGELECLGNPERPLTTKDTRDWISRSALITIRTKEMVAAITTVDATIERALPRWIAVKSPKGRPPADADRYLVWQLRRLFCSLPEVPPKRRHDPYASHWVEKRFAPVAQAIARSVLQDTRPPPTLAMIKKLYDEFPSEAGSRRTKKKNC